MCGLFLEYWLKISCNSLRTLKSSKKARNSWKSNSPLLSLSNFCHTKLAHLLYFYPFSVRKKKGEYIRKKEEKEERRIERKRSDFYQSIINYSLSVIHKNTSYFCQVTNMMNWMIDMYLFICCGVIISRSSFMLIGFLLCTFMYK